MKLLALHISDIHLKTSSERALERLKQVAPAIQNLCDGETEVLVIISGDVVWSGEALQYATALKALLSLQEQLKTKLNKTNVQLFVTPGNHDCYLVGDLDARNHVLNGVRSSATTTSIQPSSIKLCSEVQKNFNHFAQQLMAVTPLSSHDEILLEYGVPIGDQRIIVRCYNTAWMSTDPEKQGSLIFPERYMGVLCKEAFDFSISVLHHPYGWLRSDNGLAFRKHLEATSDLVLTGHEHDGSQYEKKSFTGTATSYFEGAVFDDHHDADRSAFMSVLVDLGAQKQRVFKYDWKKTQYQQSESTSGWAAWSRGAKTANRDFAVAPTFLEYLNDLGVVISHPTRERLSLQDIYILPDFREIKGDTKSKSVNKLIEGDDFIEKMSGLKKSCIFGSQQSGKTCLAKKIFVHFYQSNITPVLIRGGDINGVTIEHAEKLLEKAFANQYVNPELPIFNQLDRDKVCIIIDDFEKALNPRGRARFLEALTERYERVCVLADDLLKLEELLTGDVGWKTMGSFGQFQIQEFGHLLRNRLIHRWYEIGSEYVADPSELEDRVHRSELLINDLLGRSYLPSFPVFILSFLQAHELGSPIATDAGTYGSLYEVLITGALASIKSKRFNLDTRRTYLSELAYWLFCKNQTQFSDADWTVFHAEYCEKFQSKAVKRDLKDELFEARMFVQLDGLNRFRHPYYYYYFVARYFHNNLHLPEIRARIETLCDQLDREEPANICLFLTHLSKDPFILDTILARASKIFSEHEPAQFKDDLGFFKNLSQQLPSVTLSDGEDFVTRKERRLRQMDEAQASEIQGGELTQDVIDMVNRFKLAIRTLEVLGQIVKNFHGSLVGPDKLKLVEECYLLGLRTLEMIFSTVRANAPDFIEWFYERVRAEHPDLVITADIQAKIKQSIFYLVEIGCFGMLKRISHSVGHTQLETTYAEILKSRPTNAVRLIDTSIKLDTLAISEVDLAGTKRSLNNCNLSENLLNRLAVYYLYIFPSTERVRQRVCSELGIQRLTELEIVSNAQKKLPSS
jgi:Calcineurin-like phosphoesterase